VRECSKVFNNLLDEVIKPDIVIDTALVEYMNRALGGLNVERTPISLYVFQSAQGCFSAIRTDRSSDCSPSVLSMTEEVGAQSER
jgi:hypothetical protein